MQIDKKFFENILYTNDRPDVVMAKGKGSYLWDTGGKKYLDFISGWDLNSLGHSQR
jgi:acetylornithine/succinyldiaminopimelate/putrescine aminotransferase